MGMKPGRMLLMGIAFAAMAFYGAGCGFSFSTLCEERSDCINGGENDTDACIEDFNHDYEIACDHGCGEEADLYWECVEAEAECNNNVYGVPSDRCEDETRDYTNCINS